MSKKVPEPAAREPAPREPITREAAIRAAVEKYTQFGWTVIITPSNSLNDIIASKDKKLHFVQVVTAETIDESRHTGLAKNTFIQNAFSNMAAPIFAHAARAGRTINVTFENVNDRTRVIVGGVKRQQQ